MGLIFFWFILAIIVAVWAGSWGRSGFGYFLLAAILSPLIAGIILLVSGKKKDIEQDEIVSEKTISNVETDKENVEYESESNLMPIIIIVVTLFLMALFYYFIMSVE